MKISKEEKALIKAYVNLQQSKLFTSGGLEEEDSRWLENECTKMIENRNCEYRFLVEDFIIEYVNKINK